MRQVIAALTVCLALVAASVELSAGEASHYLGLDGVKLRSDYPWKRDIMTTYFWVGQGASGYNSMTNYKSAWDMAWTRNFGGVDCPAKRFSEEMPGTVSLPTNFAPTLNPYYVALPYNDVKYPDLSRKYVPWWDNEYWKANRLVSQCKGRWVLIEFQGRVCFAQWEDVGPFRYDHVGYVFGNDRPKIHSKAGLDVSPAVRDYLGLSGLNKTNWRFVDNQEVPYGPWIKYAEQALVYAAIKAQMPPKSAKN